MESLSSLLTSSKDPYEENVKIICNFAKTDSNNEAIKSIGRWLKRVEVYSKPYYWARGTTLEGTVKVLKETVEKTFDRISTELREGQDAALTPEGIIYSTVLHNLEKDLMKETSLLSGLKRINAIYQKRYKNEPNHKGLKELETLYETTREQVESDAERAQDLMGIKKIMKEPDESEPISSFVLIEKPVKTLEDYCAVSRISLSRASQLIQEGKKLLQEILKGKRPPSKILTKSQHELAALSWHLMSRAIQKGEGHVEGAFIIEDSHHYLYQFLLDSPGAKTRSSSHFVGRSPKDKALTSFAFSSTQHHGIDVLKELPAGKRTILFEQIDNPSFIAGIPSKVLFLKLENYSPFLMTSYGYDALMHGFEFVNSQYKKKFHPGSDDQSSMRKERIPANIIKKFQKVVNFIKKNINDFGGVEELVKVDPNRHYFNLETTMKNAKLWGIMYIHQFLHQVRRLSIYPEEFNQMIRPLEEEISRFSHPEKRTGREVYITAEELGIA